MSQDILDIFDSEMAKIIALHERLNERARDRKHNYTAFEKEIREEFAALGFTVDVNWYEFSVDGAKQDGAMPEVTITGRTDTAFRFDPDRQVHEVTHDILGLGDEGVIKTDPDTLKNFLDGNGGHGHGHQH